MLNCLGVCCRDGIRLAGSDKQTVAGKPGALYSIGGAYCRTCERRILQSSLIHGKCPCCKGKVRLNNRHKSQLKDYTVDNLQLLPVPGVPL